MIQLTIAEEKDLIEINRLAQLIWNDHYVPIIGQQQVDYMLDKMYSFESLLDQIKTKKHVFYLIENNKERIGFISINVEQELNYFINKFYIHQQNANSGIGTQSLKLLIDLIKPKSLTLTVNRQNFKSINFYFKNGFKIKKVENFDIGNGFVMNDFIMERLF